MMAEDCINKFNKIIEKWVNEYNAHVGGQAVLGETRLKTLSKNLDRKIDSLRDSLNSLYTKSTSSDETLLLEEYIDKCEVVRDAIDQELSHKIQTVSSPPKISTSLKLPKLELSPFYGDVESYQQFWSLFTKCVDLNTSLDDSMKLSYLVSLLKGEAANVVAGMNITPANYKLAKELLQKRFGRPEKIIHSYFSNILNLKSCSNTLNDIREFYNSLLINIRSLENENVKIDDHSVLLCSPLLQKLPLSIKKACIDKFGSNPWKISTILEVLEKTVLCYESLDFENKNICDNETELMTLSTKSQNQQFKACVFCDLKNHQAYNCKRYSSFSDRLNCAKRKNLCTRCLLAYHPRRDCQAKFNCVYCDGDHNRLLCKMHLNPKPLVVNTPKYSKLRFPSSASPQGRNSKSNSTNVSCNIENGCIQKESNCNVSRNDAVQKVSLQQAAVKVSDLNSCKSLFINLLFDSGSEMSFISQSLVNKLQLPFDSTKSLCISSFMHQGTQTVTLR